MKILPGLIVLTLVGMLTAGATPSAVAAQTAAPAVPIIDASAPIPKRGNARFYELHASFLKRAKEGPMGVLFLGDSITEGWAKAPAVWQEHFGKYQPANFGIGGDQTQHVIWRIEDGELDGIKPKVVVLMIGTNNTGSHTGAEIAAADEKIVGLIRTKLPETKILLLAIFPRGPRAKNKEGVFTDDGVKRMAEINEANTRIARLDDGKTVRFLNINPVFLGADGKIPDAIMPDQLHPNAEGYRLWADAIQPLLDEMMK
jgi:lysophospholipase L1-like esterase